jgi:hypothetical protein
MTILVTPLRNTKGASRMTPLGDLICSIRRFKKAENSTMPARKTNPNPAEKRACRRAEACRELSAKVCYFCRLGEGTPCIWRTFDSSDWSQSGKVPCQGIGIVRRRNISGGRFYEDEVKLANGTPKPATTTSVPDAKPAAWPKATTTPFPRLACASSSFDSSACQHSHT